MNKLEEQNKLIARILDKKNIELMEKEKYLNDKEDSLRLMENAVNKQINSLPRHTILKKMFISIIKR